jgi:hypothetical protein
MAISKETSLERAFRELNAPQLALLRRMNAGAKLIAFMMPRQVGKTHFGVWVIREVMREYTNAQAIFLAKDFPSIKRNTQEKFFKLFPEPEFSVTTAGVSYPNPSQKSHRGACYLTGVDKNPHKIRGGTMGVIHWSEVAFSRFQQGESFRSIHQTIVLPMRSRTFGYYMMETTPCGSNFWKDFWDEDPNDPEALSRGFTKVRFPLELCISLGAISRKQADEMEGSMHPDVFKQEMLVEFVTFMGKIYAEFDEDRHLADCEPESHERVIIGIDIGHTAAFSALFAVWRDKQLYIFDQVYQKGLRIGQMVDLIEERLTYWRIPRENWTAYTDHDPEMIAELQERKIKVDYADKLDPFACRMSIKESMYFNKLHVSPRCIPLRKEIGAAVWSQTRADEMSMDGDPNQGHWDSEASLRYLWRGSKLELEKPEEASAAVKADPVSLEEWHATAGRREAKRERGREVGKDPIIIEY